MSRAYFAGLVLNVPLGYRYENGALRRARLELAQYYLGLKEEEDKAERFLTKAYLDVLNISAQQETFAYDYLLEESGPRRKPVRLPVILPMLGLKGTY